MNSERRNITQPADWWAAIERAADKAGLTVSEWIGEAAVDKLPVSVARKLSERPTRGQPRKETVSR